MGRADLTDRLANGIPFESLPSQLNCSFSSSSSPFASVVLAPPATPYFNDASATTSASVHVGNNQPHASSAAQVPADRSHPSTQSTAPVSSFLSPSVSSTSHCSSTLSSGSSSSFSSSSFSSPTLYANFDLQDYDVPEISKMVASDWLEADLGMLSSL